MTGYRGVLITVAAFVVFLVAQGLAADPGFESFEPVVSSLWGRIVVLDLGLGLLVMAGVIGLLERTPGRAAGWIAALVLLGNPVSAVWLVINAPSLAARRGGRG